MRTLPYIFAALLAAALTACGGGSGSAASAPVTPAAPSGPMVLAAGATHVMAASETVLVPPGSTVHTTDNSTVNINGQANTINVPAGSIVTVPASATGVADNRVVAGAAVSVVTMQVQLLAGGGAIGGEPPVDGNGAQARFFGVYQMALDGSGNLYAADRGALRRVTPSGVVSTLPGINLTLGGLAGDGAGHLYGAGAFDDNIYRGTADGGLQLWASGWHTAGSSGGQLAADGAGNVYLADFGGRRIVKFSASGSMSVLAGGGSGDGNDGVGAQAAFHGPSALALDASGALLVNDSDAVRKVLPDGTVRTLASIPKRIIPSDGSIAVDPAGNVFVANDSDIRWIKPDGTVSVVRLANGSMPYIMTLLADPHGGLYAATGWASPVQIWKLNF